MKKKLIFELDNILVGDITYLLNYKNLISFIKNNCKHKKINGNICDIDENLWKKNISPLFFRPFLKEFFNKYKSKYDFYIFTLLEKNFAIELTEIIEDFFNISFKKPIFTKEDLLITSSGKYKKNISLISPISSPFFIIDFDYYWNDNKNIIIPTSYNYTFIPIIDSNLLFLLRTITNKQNFNLLPTFHNNNYEEFYFNYHLFTAQLFKSIKDKNEESLKDDYFNNISVI